MSTFMPIETLLDGVMETLRREILPNLPSPRARGQLYAALDVLNNLRDRVEPRCASTREEADSAETALRDCIERLRDGGATVEAERIQGLLAPALQNSSDEQRAAELRSVLASAIAVVATLPEAAGSAAAAALDLHLLQQTFRDLAGLKLSPLAEISKG